MVTNRHSAKYISCHRTENSETKEQIISLGKALVNELGLDQSTDTLGRWMAHYIAERITAAENATDQEKSKVEKECFEAVLKLWQHRAFLPNGHRPFENFEPILRALERLDPESERTYFFDDPYKKTRGRKTDEVSQRISEWIDVALGIDQVARIWIDYVFKQAANCAGDKKTKACLQRSVSRKDKDISIIFSLLSDDMLDDEEGLGDNIEQKKRELIASRMRKLESFRDFNEKLLSILNLELENM
ncbi:MAG: hypothetical protein APF81_14045 [Desulfosporosinus sp. BRH_c37]|nr:MAG: hypothetical protein APF81_14045 [Desulfosporosinus sp. BRH_c37]